MSQQDAGFHSDGLRAALKDALSGKPAELERLLARLGAAVTAKPNLRLAAAFGTEVATLSAAVMPLLRRLAAEDAAPDSDRVFLPIAAAHGWVGRLRSGRDVEASWVALAELAADERAPVRRGTRDALLTLALQDGLGDALVARAVCWLHEQEHDRELRLGAATVVVEILGDRRVQNRLRDHTTLFHYLSRILEDVAATPRSAERSDARRRLLAALPEALAVLVGGGTRGEAAEAWWKTESARAEMPSVREVLSNALIRMRAPAHRQNAHLPNLRQALEQSAKPLRDPGRLRPGTGRGKATRRIR
jgi:hypothetical protein